MKKNNLKFNYLLRKSENKERIALFFANSNGVLHK